ncbi:MAG: polyphosphate:AMP phosphotransferase [Elusimicrobia bacterium]|nr:polyphosphate:AMP phosphotransferase [Elusimicrobiota bacterium]
MFEAAEVGAKVDKAAFKKEEARLRPALLAAQRALAGSRLPVIVLVSGVETAGKTTLVNTLLDWLDARGVQVHAPDVPTDEERARPEYWRWWRMLPPAGHAAVFLGSWYTSPIVGRVFKDVSRTRFEEELERIERFERMLTAEGTLLVKLWLHITKKEQKRRLEALEADKETRWRVTGRDWRFHKRYDRFLEVSEGALRRTSTGCAPWTIVEAADRRHVTLTAVRALLEPLKARLAAPPPPPKPKPPKARPPKRNVLRALDYASKLEAEDYEHRLAKAQGRIGALTRRLRAKGRSLVLVFEGPDAAGKGGAIRRLTQAMDVRLWRHIAVAAPSDEERAHPYLWRFWRELPGRGRVTVYDRSWYGRVLVERVEGFCADADWRRAYSEINDFEEQLAGAGAIVRKFWLATTPDEQLRRFKDRETTPYKQYKITPEDWRNRGKWEAYEAAACEMIEKTSTAGAPWVLVEANDKRWARVKVAEAAAQALKEGL